MRGTNEEQKRLTRDSLLIALMELWETKPFEKITVTELTHRAGVSRMAFYRNYDSIAQIVTDHMQELYGTNVERLAKEGHTKYADYAIRFFRFVAENESFMRKALDAGFGFALLESIEDYIGSEIVLVVSDVDMTRFSDGHLRHFVAGGSLIMLERWLEGGMVETPEQMGELAARYIHGLLGPGPGATH